jgi:hypothetical protein
MVDQSQKRLDAPAIVFIHLKGKGIQWYIRSILLAKPLPQRDQVRLGIENLIITLIEFIIGEVSISLGNGYITMTRKLLSEF